MKNKFIILAVAFIVTSSFSTIQPANKGTLIFYASDFSDDEGQAVIYLYRQQDEVPGSPFIHAISTIKDEKATIVFNDLPYNDYAAILCHDKNSNGKIDHRWGFPSEPLGYTNGWKLSLVSGMPRFSKLKFEFSSQKSSYKINLQE